MPLSLIFGGSITLSNPMAAVAQVYGI